jgi:hypothetical protein
LHDEAFSFTRASAVRGKETAMKNSDRVKRASNLVAKAYNDDEETNVRDLLSDLMHLCEYRNYDFTEQLRIATDNFNAELWDADLKPAGSSAAETGGPL